MKLQMAIQGIGAVGGFGCGVDALHQALRGPAPTPTTVEMETVHGPCRVLGLRADATPLRGFVPVRVMRRMEHHIRIALLAAFDALGDAERRGVRRPQRLGIVMATGYGATCNSFDFQHLATASDDFSGSPTQFSNSVHNAAAAYLSIALSENGPNHTVSHYDLSVPMALSVAAQWLAEDRVDAVLTGAVDEFSKAQACAWQARADADPAMAGRPAVGEGACFLLLTAKTGGNGAYGHIEATGLGRQAAPGGALRLPHADQYIIAADGFGTRDGDYAHLLPQGRPAATYTHVYGVLPVGMAFDLALAALSLETGCFSPGAKLPLQIDGPLAAVRLGKRDRLCCLKLGAEKGFGWATLTGAGSAP
jgi:3-oxoacyl-[acyl-carrier-protein] synthase II